MIGNGSGGALRKRRDAEVMLPKVMKPAGYVTGSIGKWSQLPFEPGDWGFDEYLTWAGSGLYWREAQRDSYTVNGKKVDLPEGKYIPDIMHNAVVDFITRHKDRPFYLHYPMSHIHAPIVRTPDSAKGGGGFLADNVTYMDKLVGKLVAELERLKLCEKTLVIYTGDNGSVGGRLRVNGKRVSGAKGSMWEGGVRVPLIANWPGTTPPGKVSQDLIDFSDFYPTFAEIGGAKLPDGVTIDGRSFAPQIKGQPGNPREWVYVELEGACYVRNARWKLSGADELFDMKDAPFAEPPVAADGDPAEAAAARKHLQDILDTKLAGHPKGKKLTVRGKRPDAKGAGKAAAN
jgi:arylsulfatase A